MNIITEIALVFLVLSFTIMLSVIFHFNNQKRNKKDPGNIQQLHKR